MHILQVSASAQTITIIPREFVYSSEDLDYYFERVLLDGGTLEAEVCVQAQLTPLMGLRYI